MGDLAQCPGGQTQGHLSLLTRLQSNWDDDATRVPKLALGEPETPLAKGVVRIAQIALIAS